jgi:RNA polymerase sigma factor (sigma-70 family)
MKKYLGFVEYDDLFSAGVLGLVDAIDKFDSGKNVKFETYASYRIRGAMIDYVRRLKIVDTVCLDDVDIKSDNLIHLEYFDLYRALDLLTEQEKKTIILHYFKNVSINEISKILKVSQSRTSQIHKSALKKIKQYMM